MNKLRNARSGRDEIDAAQAQTAELVRPTLFGQRVFSEPAGYLLGRYPFPARLHHPQLRRLRTSKNAKWIDKGKILFRQDDLPRAVCVVVEGRIQSSISSPRGRTIVLGFFGPGSVIGLEANILGRAYVATAETLEKTLVVAIPRRELLAEIQGNAEAGWLVARLVSENFYFLAGRLASVDLSESAPQTVARCLMELTYKRSNGDGQPVQLDVSQEVIGQLLGLSRETVSRQLARFRRAGLLEWHRSNLVIRDRRGLEKVADFPGAAA